MLITLHDSCDDAALVTLTAALRQAGALSTHALPSVGERRLLAPGVPAGRAQQLQTYRGVRAAAPVRAPYALVSRELNVAPSTVQVGPVTIGGPHVVLMAGPCAVESAEQIFACARAAQAAGAQILRGGAFKPRTSPHAFTGLKEEGLRLLHDASRAHGLVVVTEVMDAADVPLVASYADMLQIGARNMQNFTLLAAIGRQAKPVLLKRGLSATYEEWLLAAEHIRVQGNDQIVLCERGIRTFERATRNTLDLAAVPVLRQMTPLPIVVDPSHGTGRRDAVRAMARASVAAGADGLLIECHPDPAQAWSDGPQSLTLADLQALAGDVALVARAVGRSYSGDGDHGATLRER